MGVDFRQFLVLVGGRDGGVVTKSARELVCLGMGRARHPKPHTPLLWTERVVVANGLGRKEEGIKLMLSEEDFAIGVRDETSSLVREKS